MPSLDPTRRLGGGLGAVAGDPHRLGAEAAAHARRSADRAAVATAAELLGLGRPDDRHGGRPTPRSATSSGSRSAASRRSSTCLAGAQVKLEFARPAVYAAAWSLDDRERPVVAGSAHRLAKACASDAATEAARVSLQVHGAIGYTWECDLHLYLKRAWALAEAWGSAADHRGRILLSLVDEVRPTRS